MELGLHRQPDAMLPHINGFVDGEGRTFGESPKYPGYVCLTDVCTGLLGQQSQSGSLYMDGKLGYPNLGDGLRFQGSSTEYHSAAVHPEDVYEFVQRVKAYRAGYHGTVLVVEDNIAEQRKVSEEEWLHGLAFLRARGITIDRDPYDFYEH